MNITDEEKKKYLISKAMSVEAYIEERILDQVNTYYNPSSQKNSQTINKWNRIVFIGGLAGIVLAAAGAFGFSVYTAAWVAVIGTITTSITAYLFAGRYSYLALSYQSTAMQLKDHLAEWHISDKSNKSASDLIISCERTISIENQAWMAELSKKNKAIVPESMTDIDKNSNNNHDD